MRGEPMRNNATRVVGVHLAKLPVAPPYSSCCSWRTPSSCAITPPKASSSNITGSSSRSSSLQALAMGLQAVGANHEHLGSTCVYLSVGGILLFVLSFSLGAGPVLGRLLPEIFPIKYERRQWLCACLCIGVRPHVLKDKMRMKMNVNENLMGSEGESGHNFHNPE
ncbi:hypothetical protein BS78_07G115900 [Paspalum vaginatum]|nr:hypothetical protein BS78_07G115900 [Paspalum vaginatum]